MSAGGQLDALSDADRWRVVRRFLNQNRSRLTGVADRLYPGLARVATTQLLSRPVWLPGAPLPLDRMELTWIAEAPQPTVRGTERTSTHLRPQRRRGGRYRSYAETIEALDPPTVFEDRNSYRLIDADLSRGVGRLSLNVASYFDGVNVGEALAHELAAASMEGAVPALDRLPFRSAVGDPVDLARRAAIPAISVLTLRRDTISGDASFILHWRDPAKVVHAGGLYQVMPVGVFQPSADEPWNEQNDFDLWRCMVREYAEEFLGSSEDHGTKTAPLDYDRWPFYAELTAARRTGSLCVYCLGIGVDPLTHAVDLLVVAVFDHDVFDRLLGRIVEINAEGRVINGDSTVGIPFTADAVRRFGSGHEPMQPAGAAVLELAWFHRKTLLNSAYDRRS